MITRFEIRRIAPLRAANITGVLLFCLYGPLASPMGLLVSVAGAAGAAEGEEGAAIFMGVYVCAYPIAGAVFGWIFGGLGALLYNYIVRFTGGHQLEMEGENVPSVFE